MRTRTLIALGLGLAGLAPAGLAAGKPPAGAVATLDRLMQERFEKLDEPVGISRLPTAPNHGELMLRPQGTAEKRALRDLEEAEWDAVFYVAGRALLARPPVGGPRDPGFGGRVFQRGVTPAVVLTSSRPRAPLPHPGDLAREGQAAFAAFARGKGHSFEAGEWWFVTRPIPASHKKCLGCHKTDEAGKPLKLGAPLGVALYGFAPVGPNPRRAP